METLAPQLVDIHQLYHPEQKKMLARRVSSYASKLTKYN